MFKCCDCLRTFEAPIRNPLGVISCPHCECGQFVGMDVINEQGMESKQEVESV